MKRVWENTFVLNKEEMYELAECLKGKKNYKYQKMTFDVCSEKLSNYYLIEEDRDDEYSRQWFKNMNNTLGLLRKSQVTSNGVEHWDFASLSDNHSYFHNLLNDYIVDHMLKIWDHLFHKHSPSILCMNSKVPNLFMTKDTVSIQTTITSLHRLSKGKLFKGIDMFLCPICDGNHYYLLVINLAKNEGYVIDGNNCDQAYTNEKRTYMQRALALLLLCQELKY